MKRGHTLFFFTLLLGVILTFGGFLGWYSYAFLSTIFYLFSGLVITSVIVGYLSLSLSKSNGFLLTLLVFIWALHLLQVFVPETGFDALWYHLPVADTVVQQQQFVFIPEIYQSVNPLFADTFFFSGYAVFSELGAKIVAYLFGLLLVVATYLLSNFFFSEKRSLQIVVLVSLFQVVAWQSSSFYVDVAKAVFELVMLLFVFELLEKKFASISTRQVHLFSFGLSVGAIFATKLFSLLLLPFLLYCLIKIFQRFPKIDTILLLLPGLILPLLYFSFTYQATGNPFYSVFHHIDKLGQIGSSSSLRIYIFDRLLSLPVSFFSLLTARDYVYPLIAFIPFVALIFISKVLKEQKTRLLFYFGSIQWVIWWFVPPLSTRYALSGFIAWLVLGVYLLIQNKELVKNFFGVRLLTAVFWISVVVLLLPRLIVAQRSMEYLLSMQTTEEYLDQFYDGSIDEKIDDWYLVR